MKPIIILLSLGVFLNAATYRIGMVNYSFSPQDQNVAPGDTVRWINQSTSPHTSTSGTGGVPDSLWNSGTIPAGDSFTLAINLPSNTYHYYCAFHWQMGMTGTITVGTGIEEKVQSDKYLHKARISSIRPNPFRRAVRIDYSISQPDLVEITIFSNTGRRVITLLSDRISTGTHSITWEGHDDTGHPQPDGIYYLRLQTGSGHATQKLLLFK